MKKTNLVIWIIGGSSVGKTTQARLIHSFFSSISKEKITLHKYKKGDVKYFFTGFNEFSCNLGDLTRGACSGTDTLSKKEQIVLATHKAKSLYPVVVVEGIMATGQWPDFLKDSSTLLFTVHLDVAEEDNFIRLKQRRGHKLGVDPTSVEIMPKTVANLLRKLRNFRNLYKRVSSVSDVHLSLDTSRLSIEAVHKIVQQQIKTLLLSKDIG